MYRVSILKRQKKGSTAVKGTQTRTSSFATARNAFMTLREKNQFDGEDYILMLTKRVPQTHPKKLAFHLFNAKPGTADYFTLNQTITDEG